MSGNGILVPREGGVLRGNITTLTHGFTFELRPHPRYEGKTEQPKYEAFMQSRQGVAVAIGAAWEKTAQAGPNPGSKFLSISLDDPSFDAPLNVTAFPRDGGGFEIVWRRTRERVSSEQVARGMDEQFDRRRVDDEIPF